MKGENGITLIALVITIIVMLILAAVTITLVVNGNLIGYAQTAKSNTLNAMNDENTISQGKVTYNGTPNTDIQNIVDNNF